MRVTIAVFLCLLINACATSRVRNDANYASFTIMALLNVEGRQYCVAKPCKFTYVVPTSVDSRAREALAAVRKVVAPSEVPESLKISLSNNIEIHKLQIIGDVGLIEGTIYPYDHNGLNCGVDFSYPFKYVNGAWQPLQAHWRMC